MKKTSILFTLFIALSISFWSCQNEQMPVESTTNISTPLSKGGVRAELYLKIVSTGFTGTGWEHHLKIHMLTEPWKEKEASWNNRLDNTPWSNPLGGGTYDDNLNPTSSAIVKDEGLIKIDITDIFNTWLSGTPNYGLMIEREPLDTQTELRWMNFFSKESMDPSAERPSYIPDSIKSVAPYILISTEGDNPIKLNIVADSYLMFQYPTSPNAWDNYTVLVSSSPELKKHAVLLFDIPGNILPADNCTHTKGYWKTHAKGKKKDTTWDLLEPDGKNTEFFKSQKSYYKVLWSPPRRGNVYYLLAYEYIAAQLNQLNGAEPSEINDAFNTATKLFEVYTPKKIKRLRRNNDLRKQFLKLAKELRSYNTGEIGPGHCDDYKWHKKDKDWKKWWKKKWGKKP